MRRCAAARQQLEQDTEYLREVQQMLACIGREADVLELEGS